MKFKEVLKNIAFSAVVLAIVIFMGIMAKEKNTIIGKNNNNEDSTLVSEDDNAKNKNQQFYKYKEGVYMPFDVCVPFSSTYKEVSEDESQAAEPESKKGAEESYTEDSNDEKSDKETESRQISTMPPELFQ